jgi:ABC-type transporter Mla maintaining outer membrane lipid asymmetry permease subunit MlaE
MKWLITLAALATVLAVAGTSAAGSAAKIHAYRPCNRR